MTRIRPFPHGGGVKRVSARNQGGSVDSLRCPLLSEGEEMLKTITVTNMPRASHLADGSMVEMEFAGANGEKFALRFSPDKLESFVAQAMQLLFSARSQKPSKGDHLSIQPQTVVAVEAQAPAGGGKIILVVRATNGIPVYYSFAAGTFGATSSGIAKRRRIRQSGEKSTTH